jgi:hypothetical protein
MDTDLLIIWVVVNSTTTQVAGAFETMDMAAKFRDFLGRDYVIRSNVPYLIRMGK